MMAEEPTDDPTKANSSTFELALTSQPVKEDGVFRFPTKDCGEDDAPGFTHSDTEKGVVPSKFVRVAFAFTDEPEPGHFGVDAGSPVFDCQANEPLVPVALSAVEPES